MKPTTDDSHLIEQKIDSQEILKGNFLHAFRDTVRLPDGSSATREYVKHPGAVCMIPLLDDEGALRAMYERLDGVFLAGAPTVEGGGARDTTGYGHAQAVHSKTRR